MLTTTEDIGCFDTYSEFLGYTPERSLFFDIETTGFSPSSSIVFLIGMLYEENGRWKLTQFLAETPDEEIRLLQAFLDRASGYDTLIHFNGSTFDLPYLTKKAAQFRLPHTLDKCRSLDLYQSFRPIGRLFSLKQMKQQSLEAFVGWKRTDRLTGRDMVTLFQEYTKAAALSVLSPSPVSDDAPGQLQKLLLLHNHDDMLGMVRLLSLAAYLPLRDGRIRSVTDCSYREAAYLQLSFSLEAPVPIPFSFPQEETPKDIDPGFSLNAGGNQGLLRIPVFQGTLLHFFPDYKNYYYLPLEDEAIHKSVASFVDKNYRMPAKACNCYTKKSGAFLPQPEEIVTPAFRHSFQETQLYFICSEDFIRNTKLQEAYLSALLRTLLA